MSGLAKFFMEQGIEVFGYDRTPSPITDELLDTNIEIIFDDNPEKLPENIDLVIYTPAVKDELEIIKAFKKKNIKFVKRAEVLGWLSEKIPTIAVAGTHGKTTVSSILSHIMKTAGIKFNAFVGGISKNYSTNYIGGNKNPEWLIAEADEYDRSFLKLKPFYSVITSMDPDHLDIYEKAAKMKKAYIQFINNTSKKGKLVLNNALSHDINSTISKLSYSAKNEADVFAKNIQQKDLTNYFDVRGIIDINNVKLKMPGLHNIENSLAAITTASLLGISKETIAEAMNSYEGVKRRFDIRFSDKNIIYIDDYAHHPEELNSIISSVKELLPGKKITGIFQPHLYSRTKDFANEFAESLQMLDDLVLLEIYPARETPIKGVCSKMLLDKISMKNKTVIRKEDVIKHLEKKDFEVLLTLGAGDIDRLVEPITKLIINKSKKNQYV